jgi:hypothetical protein
LTQSGYVAEPVGLVDRQIGHMLDPRSLCDSIGGQCLRELVGHNSVQQEKLIHPLNCRADGLGIGQITGDHLNPGGEAD